MILQLVVVTDRNGFHDFTDKRDAQIFTDDLVGTKQEHPYEVSSTGFSVLM